MSTNNLELLGYRRLIVYQRMLDLVELVYLLTKKLPIDEKYGLISQMRRAVVSVLSNFVEGYLKSSKKEKQRFNETSHTSLLELEAQSEICFRLKYWNNEDYESFSDLKRKVGYLLCRYTRAIN